MSTPIDDGGPAFPLPIQKQRFDTTPEDFKQTGTGGMTLRDWFAGQATEKDIETNRYPNPYKMRLPDSITREAARYRYADAMIAARKGPQP